MRVRAVISSLASVVLGAVLCLVLFANGTLSVDGDADDAASDSTATPTQPARQDRDEPSGDDRDDEGTATGSTAAPRADGGGEAAHSSEVAQAGPSVPADDAAPPSAGDSEVAVDATVRADASPPPTTSVSANAFVATFDTPEGFYDEFDYGFSGQDPASNRNSDRLVTWTGDHDDDCGSPDTLREIDIDRNVPDGAFEGGTVEDFDRLFWWCRQHIMTAVSTVGYTIAWFSPKQYFTDISKVCWDINVTEMSDRKWTQVLFVSEEDATAYPSDRASGGFDLGFTNPVHRDDPDPSTGILPRAGNLAGLRLVKRGYFSWFEDQDTWTHEAGVGTDGISGVDDKATRYQHCIEQVGEGTIRFTQQRPETHGGFQQIEVPGTIPQGPVRVVFQDDNYNGPKGEAYDPNVNTWHWDNIVVE